ncbi:hypothetical protein J0910_24405 [Nocardiopsis sp. CNT-189]|uniref:hypothetical protein n=1 Tax=Nocardiopsis oceanisediminis TaxID=2816862 RepID=UPI003B2D5B54
MKAAKLTRRTSRAAGVFAAALSFVFLVGSSSHAEEELPVLATGEASSSSLGDSYVEVHEAKRSPDSTYVQVVWTIRARDGEFLSSHVSNEVYDYVGEGMSGITTLDEKGKMRYHPLRDDNEICICAGTYRPVDFITTVEDQKSSPYWNSFMIPKNVSEITLEVPGFKPARNIPVK